MKVILKYFVTEFMLDVMEVAMVISEFICYIRFSINLLSSHFHLNGIMTMNFWKKQLLQQFWGVMVYYEVLDLLYVEICRF